MTAGPPVFGIALLLLPLFYLSWRFAKEPKKPLSLLKYLLLSLGVGVLAFWTGMAAGIWMACSVANPGNLCGLVGVFGSGPLLAGLAICLCAHHLTRNAKRAP